jgi:ABC-type transport system involved in cytochrome c biogenesis permease subunit
MLSGGPVRANGPERLDFSTWQRMPSFHDGRMMPVNTYATIIAEVVTHRANPRLSLEGAFEDGQREPAGFDETRKLFPDPKQPRKFQAAEMLFSWLVEPQRWENVPFLIAEHEELRRDILRLPIKNAKGDRLKYVSPRQVAESTGFREHRMKIAELFDEASQRGERVQLHGVDKKFKELFDAYTTYRVLTFNPQEPATFPTRFMGKLTQTVETWGKFVPQLNPWLQFGLDDETIELSTAAEKSIEKLRQFARDREFTLVQAEPVVIDFRESCSELAQIFARHRRNMSRDGPPRLDESRLNELRRRMHTLASLTGDLSNQAQEMHLALYENGDSLRIVPALNPAALEKDRDDQDDAQPWLNLQTLIVGSDSVLEGYPKKELEAVRESFRKVAEAYIDRDGDDRPQRFAAAMGQFAGAVRTLGESIEEVRRELPVGDRDEELIVATAYPPAGSTEVEVRYYELDPFLWTWVTALASVACFVLSFGVVRKPMFWIGLAVLVLSQGFTLYGLGLRVYISGWAPVTNMFETVIFVALVVALLGLWFTLLPLTWPGLTAAWHLTAIRGAREATPEKIPVPDHQLVNLIRPLLWIARAVIAVGIFYALTMVPYGSGEGYSIVRLLPRTPIGSSTPTVGSLLVWLVGWGMMLLTLWLIPRSVLALIVGVLAVPFTFAKKGLERPLEQVYKRKVFALSGAAVAFFTGLMAYMAPVTTLDKNIAPIMPVLRDNFWLTVHVLTITAGYGAGALAWGLGLIALGYYLVGRYRAPAETLERAAAGGHRPAHGYQPPAEARRRRAPEECSNLGTYIYKASQVAFLLLAAGTILGGLWADVSWGRFWGWDSKEVWALISVLAYAVVFHGRYAGLFGNFGLAAGSVLGATAIIMAWYGVNAFLRSELHGYGEFEGGRLWAVLIVALNWAFVIAALARYRYETGPLDSSSLPRPVEKEVAKTEQVIEV